MSAIPVILQVAEMLVLFTVMLTGFIRKLRSIWLMPGCYQRFA
ncbi:hypothetical protein DAQ1742_03562 [Dickeya aquatica]|uniref:Uncharacterized protein n=1 Tax=Dickeya aquatica TaxID=1401087 RepID=A0A375AEQ4_9GAMM|nr:hypothetical protein DAQ1742_03562 [Dickeya aquatica]